MKLVSIHLIAALTVSCMATKEAPFSQPLEGQVVTVQVGGVSNSGIYRFDLESSKISQVVAVEPTPDLTKYAFIKSGLETHFYLVGDSSSAKNLYLADSPSDGSETATPTKVLGSDDLNGPAICGGGESLVVGQVLTNSIQVLQVPLPVATSPTVAFHIDDMVAGDLHCRKGIDGFFFAGLKCPAGGNLGQYFAPSNNSVTAIFHMVNGVAVPVSAPEQDPDVTGMPRPKKYGRGDVDPTVSRLSDGRVVIGFSRIINSPLLNDAPERKRDDGYFKLMLAALGSDASAPAKETQVDLGSYFRKLWQLPDTDVVDYLMSTVDVRERPESTTEVEFVTAATLGKRGVADDGPETFSGLVYGRLAQSEIGKAKAELLEMRALLTIKQLSCGIWKAKGLGEPDGKVYVYGAVFPRFVETSSVIHFSTLRGPVGDFVSDNGGSIKLSDGNVVPAQIFIQAFCNG